MECPVTETGSLFTSGIKRHAKDKRISKTAKLNVSLASKIKTKILNNSSIFKISLKHNNRALAQALSREKENSRRVTTEKMVLQKEVEKLNFENAFLRLKLNNLNKKLIEIEALMSNSLITAIEMSSLSEFNQSPFLLPASKKKRISKQCKLTRLPFARVPLTSNDDDDDDDDKEKEKKQCDNNIISKTSPDIPSSIATRQPLSTQSNLEVLFLKENNQNMYGLVDSEHISSIVDVLPKEIHSHSDQSSKSSLISDMRNAPPMGHEGERPSSSNVTERKKRGSSWESNNPSADIPCATDLDQQWVSNPQLKWNDEINDCTNETNIKMQRNSPCLPGLSSESASKSNAECVNQVQGNDNVDFQLQKTVYDADMDLTASEASNIVTVSTGIKNKSNKKPNDCEIKTFRKVKDSGSEKKKERSKRQFKNSSDVNIEEKTENSPERRSVVLDGKKDSEDPNLISSTEMTQVMTQVNILNKITLRNGFDEYDRQNTQYNKKKKRIHVASEQEEAYPFSKSSDKFQQESKFDMGQNSLPCNKSKASRQTFVIHKLEKHSLFANQNDRETISENLEVTNEFQTTDLSTKDNGNLCDYETQNILDLKKHVTDTQPTQKNESKINKLRQRVNRKTEIISKVSQIYEDNDEDLHGPEKSNIFFQTQEDKETISGNLEVSKDFQIPAVLTRGNGNSCEIQNVLGLQKQVINVYPVQQNESKVNKKLRQKVNQKTEIIFEVSHLENDKSVHYPEKGNSFFLTRKMKEIIPGNLEDSSEFQTPALSTKDSGNLCDHETQNVFGMKEHVHDMQPTCQNDLKIDKKLRQKAYRKTEIISEVNQIYENDDEGIHEVEKGNFFSLIQKDKEIISENLQVTNEFQTADLPTKDNENLCDYETQNILDLKKHVTDTQPAEQNESKVNKKLRQKVNRKTEIVSEMNQIYEDNDKGVHGLESYTKDLHFKINKSKQRLECEGIISGYYTEINNNEKESCDQIPNPYKLVKKHKKESSSKAKNILTKIKNKPVLQLTDSSQTSVSLESGFKHVTKETDSGPGNQTELPKNQKRSTTTLSKKGDLPFVEVVKEGECQVKKGNKMTSKSKKRKTFIDPSPDSHDVMEITPNTVQGKSVDSEQTDKENNLENEKTVKIKPDFYTKVFQPLSQIYSPNIQDSSFDSVQESSVPLSISSTKSLIIKENFALENSPIFQESESVHEKMKEMKFKVNQRTQKSGIGDRLLQDLTNTSIVPNNTAESENKSEDLSSELPSRRRRCVPLDLKEPSLKRKMRR